MLISDKQININNKEDGYFNLKADVDCSDDNCSGILVNNNYIGACKFKKGRHEVTLFSNIKLTKDSTISFIKQHGEGECKIISLTAIDSAPVSFKTPTFTLTNKNATENAKNLMKYFSTTYTKKIISGQHTNIAIGKELDEIYELTGKYPAIRSFDYLGTGQGTIDVPNATEWCLHEIKGGAGMTDQIINWVKEKGGIATSCWHWFSPLNGTNQRFYTEWTDFDVSRAVDKTTPEYAAINSDMDLVAKQLLILKEEGIPLLWRPFHEADGGWFWWGAKGPEPYKALWKIMYNKFVNEYKLDNLIWVWNAPQDDWYVGDEYCDIVGNDIYCPTGQHGPSTNFFNENLRITGGNKPVTLSENGMIPDPDLLKDFNTNWLYFTTWGWKEPHHYFNNEPELLKKYYNNNYVITLEDLPKDLFSFN